MTPVEILALIFAALVILKVLILTINRNTWKNFALSLYNNPVLTAVVELILAIVVFYYLSQELTIVQITAALLLGSLLTGMSFAVYGKEFKPIINTVMRQNIWQKAWLLIVVWLAFMVWVLMEIF
ncbi:MAG: hypothetical protein Q8P15_00515 [Nanoarchaeota archaeon]|nr:hypothetical protein [Nanoarchaeota archaeon]